MIRLDIAGIPVEINNKYNFTEWVFHGHRTEIAPFFEVSATEDEIKAEIKKQNGRFSAASCEGSCLYRKIALKMLDYDGFLLHAAAVVLDREAYVFTAPGGTGKSTHVNYWIQAFGERAYILNGDKPIIRWVDGIFYACGTPWRGKERLGVAQNVPLKAVCLLERSTENEIERASDNEIVDKIFHQVLMPIESEQIIRQLDLLNLLVTEIPIYKLKCNLSPEAAVVAYNGMNVK